MFLDFVVMGLCGVKVYVMVLLLGGFFHCLPSAFVNGFPSTSGVWGCSDGLYT